MPTGPVFISHSSRDAAIARELVAALEAGCVACWISGRDVAPGANYQESIVAAIRGGSAMVVLVSEAANASDEVKKELSLASAAGVAVYPVRLGVVTPNAALSYELATRQWIEGGDVPAIAARLAVAIGGNALPRQDDPAPTLALPDNPSIAVLPFTNIGGDPEQEYFADGMTEEIITALSRIRSFFVIARNSSFTYKGRAVDVKQMGRELGVRFVVDGSVRKGGNRVRIAAQLADAATGTQLWADRFDGAIEDVFDLQDKVAGSIIGAIEPRIRAAEIQRAQRKPPESLHAYDLALRALAHLQTLTRDGLDAAERLSRQAIALDPRYGLAYVLAARSVWQRQAQGWAAEPQTMFAEARSLARTALEFAPDDPEVLALAGYMLAMVSRDPRGGMAHLQRALVLNPSSVPALGLLAQMHAYCNDLPAALECAARAARLDPLADQRNVHIALMITHFTAGRYQEALDAADRLLADTPISVAGLRFRATCLGLLGRIDEAREAVAQLLRVAPNVTIAYYRATHSNDGQLVSDPEYFAAYCEGLRRGGLPEG